MPWYCRRCAFAGLRCQAVFMVQATDNRVGHNAKMVWNTVTLLLEWDRKGGWRIRDSRTKANVGAASIIMRDPALRNDT